MSVVQGRMNARLFRHCPLAFVLLLCTTAFAQAERDYPHKQTVEAYVTAFNSGDDAKMSAFFTANLAESSLQQRPMAERIERYRSMHDQIKTVTLRGISEIEMSAEKQSVTAEMRA